MIDFTGVFQVIGAAFFDWLRLFVAPLENLDMLWIIVPVWVVWIFSEFFQEKKGTSFGNAISNGATMLFVGVDWTRYVIRGLASGSTVFGAKPAILLAISGWMLLYGLAIIILGVKANKFVKLIGRVRETTYFMVMFSPIIYGVEDFTFRAVGVILAFFPLFYILVEMFDKFLPTPQTFELEESEKLGQSLGDEGEGALSGMQPDLSQGIFGQSPSGAFKQQGFAKFSHQKGRKS